MLDTIIKIISPEWALKREFAKYKLNNIRQFASAKTTRQTGSWVTASNTINDEIDSSHIQVTARVRQLANDFPVFKKALSSIVNFTVGNGANFQMKLRRADGSLDKSKNDLIEDLWNEFCEKENCDYSKRLNLNQIARLCQRQKYESGDYIIIFRYENGGNRMLPFSLQVVDVDMLDTSVNRASSTENEVKMGIEYNKNTGVIVKYYFKDNTGYDYKTFEVDAKNVLHNFDVLRPGQLKGISPLASAVLMADSLGDYLSAELDSAKVMSRYVGFVTTSDIGNFQKYRSEYDSEEGIRTEEIDVGILEYLKPGESINFNSKGKDNSSFDPFVTRVLRMISIATNLPYEVVSGDYNGLNYSVSRMCRNDLLVDLNPIKEAFIRDFYMEIFKRFLDMCSLSGKLPYEAYMRNPRQFYSKAYFTPVGFPKIDVMRETRGQVEGIESLLMTRSEIARQEGKNFEDIMQESYDEKQMMKEYGLYPDEISKQIQTAPSKVVE